MQMLAQKKFQGFTEFEPMTSALALQYSTNWAMKTHMLKTYIEKFNWGQF